MRNDKECKEREDSTRKHGLKIQSPNVTLPFPICHFLNAVVSLYLLNLTFMGRVRFHALFTIYAMKMEPPSRYRRTETFPVVETTNLTSISSLPNLNMRSISLRKPHRKTKRAVWKKFFSEGKIQKRWSFIVKEHLFWGKRAPLFDYKHRGKNFYMRLQPAFAQGEHS